MLRAFFDDSNIRQGPVYVLAGWVAPEEKWEPFSKDWQAILDMRPRVAYFKYSEAMNLSGEFLGISESSRNEKLNLLVGLMEDYELIGISASVPHNVFTGWFSRAPAPFNNPYLMLFYGVIRRLLMYMRSAGIDDKVRLVFDSQPDQQLKVLAVWEEFVRTAPIEFKSILESSPVFRSDKLNLPLQAADFHAGWLREMNTAVEKGLPAPKPVFSRGDNLRREYNFMEWWHAAETYEHIFGHKPLTYTFGHGSPLRLPRFPLWPLAPRKKTSGAY
jgi:hypothetical protein